MSNGSRQREHVTVLVLGDIGRSPRMQYHALSLANTANKHVDIVGYRDSTPHDAILEHDHISVHPLPPVKQTSMLLKALIQFFWLLCVMLFKIPRPSYILLQNPPAIPSLLVVKIVSWLRWCRVVVDWHNFAYTLLALKLGRGHLLVRISYWYERLLAKGAFANFCVTKAMRDFLKEKWGVTATVLYDKPPIFFRRQTPEEQHELLSRLSCLKDVSFSSPRTDDEKTYPEDAGCLFYRKTKKGVQPVASRPALLVSSTSWTPDEDFSLLLDALVAYNNNARLHHTTSIALPNLVCIITGKGPQKEYYERKIASLQLEHVRIVTAWLSTADYPKLLGSADIGISLHQSSSALDLPMKVVDMFGSVLPVCAVDFSCLGELVDHGKNGYRFTDSLELADCIKTLLEDFPTCTKLSAMRKHITTHYKGGGSGSVDLWTRSWKEHAMPVFS